MKSSRVDCVAENASTQHNAGPAAASNEFACDGERRRTTSALLQAAVQSALCRDCWTQYTLRRPLTSDSLLRLTRTVIIAV